MINIMWTNDVAMLEPDFINRFLSSSKFHDYKLDPCCHKVNYASRLAGIRIMSPTFLLLGRSNNYDRIFLEQCDVQSGQAYSTAKCPYRLCCITSECHKWCNLDGRINFDDLKISFDDDLLVE